MPIPMAASMSIAHVDGSGTSDIEPLPGSEPPSNGVMFKVDPAPMLKMF